MKRTPWQELLTDKQKAELPTELRRRRRRRRAVPTDAELAASHAAMLRFPSAAQSEPVTAAQLIAQMERSQKRRAEIDPLMDKWDAAKKAGFDLDERDKSRLLTLLLTDKLDGTSGYEAHA